MFHIRLERIQPYTSIYYIGRASKKYWFFLYVSNLFQTIQKYGLGQKNMGMPNSSKKFWKKSTFIVYGVIMKRFVDD